MAGVAALSGALVAVMIRVGMLDHPVERSSHSVPTPKGGGVGIVAGFIAGMLVLQWHWRGVGIEPAVVAGAALLLGVISYLDDVFDWPFVTKLGAQTAAAAVLVAGGALFKSLALPDGTTLVLIAPGILAWALTLAWFLFVTNAVNFMDGLNGLSSGCVALAMLAAAVTASDGASALAAILAAAIAGFLPFNYPSARIFMGDVGSQVCGLLAAATVMLSAMQPRASLVAPLALLPLLLDAGFTLLRRAVRRERITQAHRGHLYQVAHRSGVPAWAVTLVYWALAAWGGALGMAAGAGSVPVWFAAAAALAAAAPFAAWAIYVRSAAKRAGLTVW